MGRMLLTIEQTGSDIRCHERWLVFRILRGLKLGRIGRTAQVPDIPSVRGMLKRVKHVVEVTYRQIDIRHFAERMRAEYQEEITSANCRVVRGKALWDQFEAAVDACLADPSDMDDRQLTEVAMVREVRLKTFAVAHQIIGGGEEGDKRIVRTKEEADHSLPYLLAVALIDGDVQPEQFAPARIVAGDVQRLLRKVTVTPELALSAQFPQQLPADLEVELQDGTVLLAQRSDYHGFYTNPFDWAAARAKFDRLVRRFTTASERGAIADVVATLDERQVVDLTWLLGGIRIGAAAA